MSLYEKKKSGKSVVRPPFIGFIKNNYLRRLAMILFAPLMFVFVCTINVLQAMLWLFKCLLINIKGVYVGIKRFWHHPRTKDEPI